MIYDDVLNITWLQDANYALTSGYPSWNGKMQLTQRNAWRRSSSTAVMLTGGCYCGAGP
jgi:hypothetical protein